ncbi:MAG: hypothetical protein M3Y77_03405 [Actinomycetota bacterium]|nr:hypothetical protein [Actinomycetota bacterium]
MRALVLKDFWQLAGEDAFAALAGGTSSASKILVLPTGSTEETTGGLR